MEVKIGVQFAPREIVLESAQTPAEVEKIVVDVVENERPLFTLVDEKGRRVLIPTGKLAYVEIAETETRRVGFTPS